MSYMTPTSVPTPYIGAETLRSDPQSETKYRVLYDSLVTKNGTDSFHKHMRLTKSLAQVKYIRLLWALLPNAVATVAPARPKAATDHYIAVRLTSGSKSREMLPNGPYINSELLDGDPALPNTNVSQVSDAHFVIKNTTWDKTIPGFDPDDLISYDAEADYDSSIYYPIGITKWSEFHMEFYNSRGEEINYGDASADPNENRPTTSRVVMMFEVVCGGIA